MSTPITTTRRAAAAAVPNQEAAMPPAIPKQQPAAVPKSDHAYLQIPLAIAMTAIIGLGVAVAGDDGPGTTATPAVGRSQSTGTTLTVPPASPEPGSHSSVCSRPDQRRCTPPSRGAPGAQLRLASPPGGRR